jgi:hypothetical protein
LAESPEELRAWELSIIDEQVPVVPAVDSSALPESSPVVEPGSTQSLSPSPALIPGMNSPMVVYPPSISSSSTADSTSQYQLNSNPILAAAANTSLPARMCTVSHCHKILPGYYRYKRCEQHRLQNRHHSQLKRVREREIKGVGPEKGGPLAEISHEIEADKDKDKLDKETDQATVALTTAGIEGKDAGSFSSTTGGGDDSESQKKSHDQVCLWLTLVHPAIVLTALSFPLLRNAQSFLVLLVIVITFFCLLSDGDCVSHVDPKTVNARTRSSFNKKLQQKKKR